MRTTAQWEAVGAWQGGTVVAVALADGPNCTRGLLASPAGAYGWQQRGGQVIPAIEGLNDLNLVTVAFAGGTDADGRAGPTTAFAATTTGRLFVAALDPANLAMTWQEVSAWAGLGVVVVIAPSPNYADDQTLFVGTPTGFFRTQDGGQSWESCNFGLLDEEALCLICAPTFGESEVLWAGTGGGGLYRSRNSARAWRESGMGLPDAAVQALAVSPNFAEDQTLVAGMEDYGIYISRDGGVNWTSFALAEQSVNALAWAHTDWMWAGTEDGLWRIPVRDGRAEQVAAAGATVMSVAATTQGHVALGLYGDGLWLSNEGHVSAEAIPWQQPAVTLHAPPLVTSVDDAIFALDGDGVIAHSLDGGAQWVTTENELLAMIFALDSARMITPDGAAQPVVFAAMETGVARWDAEVGAWLDVGSGDLQQEAALGIALSPAFDHDQTLLALGQNNELRLSQDGGATWQRVTGPWAGQSLLQARFGPDSAAALVAVTVHPAETGHFALNVWESADQGQRWEVLAGLTSGVPAALLAWPHDESEQALFLATQHRVLKLFQEGEARLLQVHQHFFAEDVRVTALATAPDYVHSQIVWAATSGGLYRSVDRGVSWALMLDLPQGLPVVWLQVTLTHVNAITLGGRVWRAAL